MASNFGLYSEKLAADFLAKRDYIILDKNFRRKWGEIDIVAKKEGILIFIEVKSSLIAIPGFEPELRANNNKMRKVYKTAQTYMAYGNIPPDTEWQIDIISVVLNKDAKTAKIKHFKNITIH